MEISVQSPMSLKLKGKHATIVINPYDKSTAYNAALLIGSPAKSDLKFNEEGVVIDGPGEYEAGGVKISGTRVDGLTVYSLNVDGVDIAVGDIAALEKLHQKMKEHNVLIVHANTVQTATFITTLATNASLFYGVNSREVVDSLAKEEKKVVQKYQITAEKLPAETETILLASS
jgi:hypothetical protein